MKTASKFFLRCFCEEVGYKIFLLNKCSMLFYCVQQVLTCGQDYHVLVFIFSIIMVTIFCTVSPI